MISGNNGNGIQLDPDNVSSPYAEYNVIQGNDIGVTATGNSRIANGGDGIFGWDATANTVGGTAAGAGNIVAGNVYVGVEFDNSSQNLIAGNLVGIMSNGTAAGNADGGVSLGVNQGNSSGNTVGGTTTGARNIISGNVGNGVVVYGTGASANLIEGNYVGTNAAGTAAVPNTNDGIDVFSAAVGNTVGGSSVSALNVISGNTGVGVEIAGAGTSSNVVAGNYIGTDLAGTLGVPNYAGVAIDSGATANLIGTNGDGVNDALERNIVSGNSLVGIWITVRGQTATWSPATMSAQTSPGHWRCPTVRACNPRWHRPHRRWHRHRGRRVRQPDWHQWLERR